LPAEKVPPPIALITPELSTTSSTKRPLSSLTASVDDPPTVSERMKSLPASWVTVAGTSMITLSTSDGARCRLQLVPSLAVVQNPPSAFCHTSGSRLKSGIASNVLLSSSPSLTVTENVGATGWPP